MQSNIDILNRCSYITGSSETVLRMPDVRRLPVFSDEAVSFLHELSKIMMRTAKEYPDAATFGFWCRRSSVIKMKENYDDTDSRFGRGIVFHITPSNVPVNFAFSMAAGLLAGNANIVRLPRKDFPQTRIISGAINELLSADYKNLAPYFALLRYAHDKEITDIFSALCDTRVIWGGDGAIADIRSSPLRKPRANEVTFADRYSIAVVDACAYLDSDGKDRIALDFYNDTYLTDQNACTSPHIVIWICTDKADKEAIKKAKDEFWRRLYSLVKEKYTMAPVQSVGKLHALYKLAAHRDVKLVNDYDALIYRVSVNEIDGSLMDYRYNSGFFMEYDAEELSEILPLCGERCQTLVYFGINGDKLRRFFAEHSPSGLDRAVPIGKSMDFQLIWDGYDLIRSFSRKINYTL